MSIRIASIVSITLILSLPFWPLAKAELGIVSREQVPISLVTPGDITGNYTVNWANLSSVPRAIEGFSEAAAGLGFSSDGIYIGAYQKESLFKYDYIPPVPIEPFAGEIEAGYMPTIYAQYRALEAGLAYARMYASVSTQVSISADVIAEGISSSIVRVPVPYSGIVPQPPTEGGAPAFLQITRISDGKSYITISGIPEITDGLPYENTVTVDDRQYMHVNAPLFAGEEYTFEYFWSLQGVAYGGEGEIDYVSPMVYYTPEDILGNGTSSTLKLGFAYYNRTTGRFNITDQTTYGGDTIDVELDAGWSIMAMEGIGGGLWGQKIDTSNSRTFTFHPTVETSAATSVVSLYIPFLCPETVELSSLKIYDNNPNAVWVKAGGAPCTGDYQYYWAAEEDCDEDGYADYPNLNFTDFILISSRTYIQPCDDGNESSWTVEITFADDYDITLLCSEGSSYLRGGGTPHTGGPLPVGICEQWDTELNGEYYTYNSAAYVYLHTTGTDVYSYYNASATGEDRYSYPHPYRYLITFIYGSMRVWLEVNESVFYDSDPIYLFRDGPDTADPAKTVIDTIYDALGIIGGVGSIAGYIWDAITWVAAQLESLGEWLWRGILTIYDYIMVGVEAIVNVMSYVIEFAIIAVSLLVFFGAIVLWNKILLILRAALKKAEDALGGAL